MLVADISFSTPTGNVKWKLAPRPSFVVADKRPPYDSTMDRLIASPMLRSLLCAAPAAALGNTRIASC